MRQVVVIGYGSIGNRHAAALSRLGCTVSIVTAQNIRDYSHYNTIEQALNHHVVDAIIIANPTHLHFDTLQKIAACHFQKTILVEKPLFSQIETLKNFNNANIYVGYNLRFHELFRHTRDLLQNDELVSFSVQVGSYLPSWRKNIDYRESYSAKKECGGGVLRDLSHELDYVLWLCGRCLEVTAMGGNLSTLEINSDDVYSILMCCENCPIVNIQLDYLNRAPSRKIMINTKKQNTIFLDLIQGLLILNGEVKFKIKDAMNKAFHMQSELMIKNNFVDFCNYQQGLSVVKLIDVIEHAAAEKKWMVL